MKRATPREQNPAGPIGGGGGGRGRGRGFGRTGMLISGLTHCLQVHIWNGIYGFFHTKFKALDKASSAL